MKKSKKKLKGMTLIEMIISIAIFAIMGSILILVGSHIDQTTRAANTLKTKVSDESPYAANHVTERDVNGTQVTLPNKEVQVKVSVTGTGKLEYYVLNDKNDPTKGTKKKETQDPSEVIIGDKYNTEDVYTDGMSSSEITAMRNRANGGLNFQFIEMQTTTSAVTTTATTTTATVTTT